MNVKVKLFFKRLLAGLGIGTGAAIPGVSGAAIAVIFKVYEDIISAVNNFRKKFSYSISVLLPILLGVVIAVAACIVIFSYAFEHLLFVLISIFAGFLIGSFPSVAKEVRGVKPNNKQKVLIVISILFVIILGVLSVVFGGSINLNGLFDEMPVWLYFVLIPVGIVAAVALTVPGLSGSLILLILGFYRPLVDHAKGWAGEIIHGNVTHIGQLIGMILCFGLGCLIGVVIVSKIMSKLLEKHHNSTFFAICGFIIGSIFVLYFNFDIYSYYQEWAGIDIVNINQLLPIYFEIPLGLIITVACGIASYFLTKSQNIKKETADA